MQKSRFKGRASAIALAALTIVCCVTLIIGATLAIFSDRKDNNISFVSGELKIDTDLTIGSAWSYDSQAEDHRDYDSSVISNDGSDVVFETGGSAAIDEEGNINMVAVPGDGVSLNLNVSNVGSVHAKYIVRFDFGENTIPDDIKVMINGEECISSGDNNQYIVVQAWKELYAGNSESIIGIELEYEYIKDVEQEQIDTQFSLSVVAIQANADIPENSGDEITVSEGDVIVTGVPGQTAQAMPFEEAISTYFQKENDSVVTITVPAGTYNIEDVTGGYAFILQNASNIVLQGAGVGETVLEAPSALNEGVFQIAGSQNVTIKNMTVQVAENGHAKANAVNIAYYGGKLSENITLQDLEVIGGTNNGININGAKNITVENVTIDHYSNAGIQFRMVSADEGKSNAISNVVFKNSNGEGNADIVFSYVEDDTSYGFGFNDVSGVVLGTGIEFAGNYDFDSVYPVYGTIPVDGSEMPADVLSGFEQYGLIFVNGGDIWVLSEASVAVTNEDGETLGAYADFESAIAAVNALDADEGTVTLTLREDASVSNSNVAKITRDDVVLDGAGYQLDLNATDCSGNGALLVSGDNVTVRNITVISDSDTASVAGIKVTKIDDPASNKVENVVLENVTVIRNNAGHAVDLNGVNVATVDGLVLENYVKTGIAVSNASNVTITNTEFMVTSGAWGDIGLMGSNNSLITVGTGNVFGMNLIYSEDANLTPESPISQVIEVSDEYGFDVFTRYENGNPAGVIIGNIVATVGDKAYGNIVDAIVNSNGEEVVLTQDVTLSAATFPLSADGNTTNIGLSGYEMTVNVQGTTALAQEGESLTITGGDLNVNFPTVRGTSAVFAVKKGATMILDGVNYTTNGAAIMPDGDAARVEVRNNSSITAPIFGIGTNATTNNSVQIVVADSTVTVTDADSMGVYINVDGTLDISNSTIEGGRQAVMVRGGTATISGSTLINNGKFEDQGMYLDDGWKDGNEVPSYALVVGNRSTSYQYATSCTVTDTVINAVNGNYVYLYGNESEEIGVTFSDDMEQLHNVVYGGGWINGQYCAGSQNVLVDALAANIENIVISESFAVTEPITVNYGATITAKEGVVLQANNVAETSIGGGINTFVLSGGAVLDGLVIDVTNCNSALTNVVWFQADATGAQLINSNIYGDWAFGDGNTVRAFVQSPDSKNVVITNNTFEGLRQPGYVEGEAEITNNTVTGTRGFVLTNNSNVTITGNTFVDGYPCDIAIINNNVEGTNYSDIVSMSKNNGYCFVDDQVNGVYCNDGETIWNTYTVPVENEWTTDRSEPASWTLSNGLITVTTQDNVVDDFYAWKGRKLATGMAASDAWEVTSYVYVTEELLNRGAQNVDTSMWVKVNDAENAELAWPAMRFHVDADGANWQIFEEGDLWNDVADVIPTVGMHKLTISYSEGVFSFAIDGVEVCTKDAGTVGQTYAFEILMNTHGYETAYTVQWLAPIFGTKNA